MQFIPITDMTGKGLADVICKTINDLKLQPEFMVGQGYDGAGAMSGHMKGVQALIQEKYPKAIYVQCSSHCLNPVSYTHLKEKRKKLSAKQC